MTRLRSIVHDSAPTGDRPRRTRSTTWAAIGAAVAVAVGGIVPSAQSQVAATTTPLGAFVPLTPCRLIDTRPDTTVGVNAGTIDDGDTFVFQVRGSADPCPASIPNDAISIVTNVTAVGPTAPTFLTLWGDGSRPDTSNLNPVPGAPPTPNGVAITLGANGDFRIFNRAGSVDVIVDVMGYHVDHDHDDRYYTEAEADARFAQVGNVYTRAQADGRFVQPAEVYTRGQTDLLIGAARPFAQNANTTACNVDGTRVGGARDGESDECVTVNISNPLFHSTMVSVSFEWFGRGTAVEGMCWLTRNGAQVGTLVAVGESVSTTGVFARHRAAFERVVPSIGDGANDKYAVRCRELTGDIDFANLDLTVLVLPA